MEPKTNGFAQSNTQNIAETNVQAHVRSREHIAKNKIRTQPWSARKWKSKYIGQILGVWNFHFPWQKRPEHDHCSLPGCTHALPADSSKSLGNMFSRIWWKIVSAFRCRKKCAKCRCGSSPTKLSLTSLGSIPAFYNKTRNQPKVLLFGFLWDGGMAAWRAYFAR